MNDLMNIKHYLNKNRLLILTCLITATLSTAVPPLGLMVAILFFGIYINRRYGIGSITAILISSMSLLAAMGVITFIIDLIAHDFRQFYFLNILIAVVNAALLFILKLDNSLVKYIFTSRKEILALAIAVVAGFIMFMPISNLRSSSEIIWFLSSGEDNASHFAMLNRTTQEQSPPYFDGEKTGLIKTLNIYPQAVQSLSGYAIWSVKGDVDLGSSFLLKAYYLITVTLSMGLIYITALTLGRFSSSKLWPSAMIIGSAATFIGVLLFLAGWGFVSQIAATLFLLSLIYFLAHKKQLVEDNLDISIISLLVIGIAYTWYLLLIPVALLLFKPALYILKNQKKDQLTLIAMFSICIGSPVILNMINSKGSGALNEPGGVYMYGAFALSVISLGLAGALFTKFKKPKLLDPTLFLFLIGSLVLSLIIGFYQIITIGKFEYYFYKSLYSLVLVAIFTLVIITSYVINWALARKLRNKVAPLIANSVIILIMVIVLYIVKPTYFQVYVNNWFNHTILPESLLESTAIFDTKSDTTKDILFIDCNQTREYISNRWNGALFLSENPKRTDLITDRFYRTVNDSAFQIYANNVPETRILRISCKNS